jgi:hypothetical protein
MSMDLSCQRLNYLIGKRYAVVACHPEPAFAHHVHGFDAGQDCPRRSKRWEAKYRPVIRLAAR